LVQATTLFNRRTAAFQAALDIGQGHRRRAHFTVWLGLAAGSSQIARREQTTAQFRDGILRRLDTSILTKDDVDRAFALLRHALPGVTLEEWRGFAASHGSTGPSTPPRDGVLIAQGDQGLILGIAIFRWLRDLKHGQIMQIDIFFVLDLLDRRQVAEALMAGLERHAARLGCRAVHITLEEGWDWLAETLRLRGHRVEGLTLCKRLAAARA